MGRKENTSTSQAILSEEELEDLEDILTVQARKGEETTNFDEFVSSLKNNIQNLSDDEKEDFVMGETTNNIDRTEKIDANALVQFLKKINIK